MLNQFSGRRPCTFLILRIPSSRCANARHPDENSDLKIHRRRCTITSVSSIHPRRCVCDTLFTPSGLQGQTGHKMFIHTVRCVYPEQFFGLTSQLLHSGHTSPILCASFSPTGNLLATGSGDCNARLWDLFTETPSHVLSGHKGWVLCVEWEAMERKLATGGHDGHVSVYPS